MGRRITLGGTARLPSPLGLLALAAAAVAIAPLVGVVATALSGGASADIAPSDLQRYAITSAVLTAGVGIMTGVIGTAAACLVALCRFPGRGVFAWALALPLAIPAFATAYGYADLLDVAGGLRTWSREHLGFDLALQMRSLPGAVFVLTCAFYPYVYLAMRAALVNQSVQALEAARMLGCSPRQALLRAALPLCRPALAAGVALAAMETLADYGAVQFLGVQTLTTGVVRAWFVYGSLTSAAQFALPLLAAAAALLWIERGGRRGRSHDAGASRWRRLEPVTLTGARALAATGCCLLLLTFGFLLPMGWLVLAALDVTPEWPRLLRTAGHSVALAGIGAVVTVLLAGLLALGGARVPLMARLASLGYATPGAVMAIGLLAPAAVIWRIAPGGSASLWVGLVLLVFAYAARLMAAALEPIEAGLSRVTPTMAAAARNLGRTEMGVAVSVQAPMVRGALLTALLLIFVDVLKELPATLILRPFNFDTLAVMADNYARDERLANAGWPAMLIVAAALPVVIWLTRRITGSRPGDDPT